MQNPNTAGITLCKTPFLLMIRDGGGLQEVANGNTGAVPIPAKDGTVFPVPVTSHNGDLVPALAANVTKGIWT